MQGATALGCILAGAVRHRRSLWRVKAQGKCVREWAVRARGERYEARMLKIGGDSAAAAMMLAERERESLAKVCGTHDRSYGSCWRRTNPVPRRGPVHIMNELMNE